MVQSLGLFATFAIVGAILSILSITISCDEMSPQLSLTFTLTVPFDEKLFVFDVLHVEPSSKLYAPSVFNPVPLSLASIVKFTSLLVHEIAFPVILVIVGGYPSTITGRTVTSDITAKVYGF